jgi:hypothetical protein
MPTTPAARESGAERESWVVGGAGLAGNVVRNFAERRLGSKRIRDEGRNGVHTLVVLSVSSVSVKEMLDMVTVVFSKALHITPRESETLTFIVAFRKTKENQDNTVTEVAGNRSTPPLLTWQFVVGSATE